MTIVQVTRDSVVGDDEVRAPHVAAAHLRTDAHLGDLAAWIDEHGYLRGTPADGAWLLHMSNRVGPAAARLALRADGRVTVEWLGDPHLPLDGVGSLHLERERSGADVLGD
ncbi:hypothetical protein IEQ44_09600 [Nocardioides sp. Y6]|uniref:Uncharacterized protein n=1 Tax=Nocardioides malaquae TaxID=2773426 RepID=A0ABR9RTJ7_9ACTN|nr:hypothetical protein [Nocardioides malaquae]MBE7324910.1 hypothetical protein [Nocardioides malaquae]